MAERIVVRGGLAWARDANVGAGTAITAQVTIKKGANTLLTIDDDFTRFDAFETEVILSLDEFAELNQYLGG